MPGGRDLARRSVVEFAVGAVVVSVDVAADLVAGVFEGFELVAPDAAFFEL